MGGGGLVHGKLDSLTMAAFEVHRLLIKKEKQHYRPRISGTY